MPTMFKKIFSAEQMRSADAYTIQHEPISSIDLMERASSACYKWILENLPENKNITIVCGTGNNGGDGLAIARMLSEQRNVTTIVLKISQNPSPDFCQNYERLKKCPKVKIVEIDKGETLPLLQKTDLLIDAIFGTGLSRGLEGWTKDIILQMNEVVATKLSIDVPSGLFCDKSSKGNTCFQADITLTFELPKLAFLFPENEKFVGNFYVLPIGLHPKHIEHTNATFYFVENVNITEFLPQRKKFSHKGTFGHSLIIAGSYGKMGAAILATKACLRAGAGLVTAHLPQKGIDCMQTAFPEAMISIDENEMCFSSIPQNLEKYTVAAIGPGLGTSDYTQKHSKNSLKLGTNPLCLMPTL